MDAMDWMAAALGEAAIITALLAALWRGRRHRVRPQICACGHGNHVHERGQGKCQIAYGVSERFPHGSGCACDIFIPKLAPTDQAARELEKLVGIVRTVATGQNVKR